MSILEDHIIETESQNYVSDYKARENAQVFVVPQTKWGNNQTAFISFMAEEQEPQEMITPYLNRETSKNEHFSPMKRNSEQINDNISSPNNQQRSRALTMIKQLQPNSFQTPTSKRPNQNVYQSFVRKNSMRTEFEADEQEKKLLKYPTEISLESEETNNKYGHLKEETKPKLIKEPVKHIKISVIDSEKQEQLRRQTPINKIQTQKMQNLSLRPEQIKRNIKRHSAQEMRRKESSPTYPNNNQIPTLSINNHPNPSLHSSRQVSNLSTQRSNPIEKLSSPSTTYQAYIQRQTQQLQNQRQRMNFYSQEANKLLCNVDTYQSSQNHLQVIVDHQFSPLKYMIEELVELFTIGQVIKYKLKYRSYEILNKMFAQASEYYQQRVQLQEPIKAYTFSLAVKALLNDYQKSQLDIVVTKIFHSSQVLSYDQFLLQFHSVLNSKLVALLEPQSMKKQVDKTLEKIKNLFVIWIESEYYTKKVKQILRSSSIVYESIISECTSFEEPQKFDVELLEKFFLQGERKNPMKKIKLDLFFRNLLGNDLLIAKWTDWINKDEIRLYNRYESKLMYERKQYERKLDKKESIILQRTQNSIVNTRRKIKINLEENHLSKRVYQSRKIY